LLVLWAPGCLVAQESADSQAGNAASATRVTVHGVVRNEATGEPLARALVQIEGDADTGTLTDGEGRFEIPDVVAGAQILRVVKPGFRDRPYASEEPGLRSEGPARSVLVAAQMPDLNFALMPNGAIRGHIELSTGDPAVGINLSLMKQVVQFGHSQWSQVSGARSNGEGDYRFGGLPDGVYAVCTLPALESDPASTTVAPGRGTHVVRNGYPSVYYPDARDLAGAGRITVANGSTAEANISLVLEPFYPVTAMAAMPGDSSSAGNASAGMNIAMVMDATGHELPYSAQPDPSTHSLQVDLPDGTYTLVVRGFPVPRSDEDLSVEGARNGFVEGFSERRRMPMMAGSAGFTVAGHAVTGVRVPLGPVQSATVRVRLVRSADNTGSGANLNGAGPLANLSLDAADGSATNINEGVWSMDNGADSISFSAQPGAYWLNFYLGRKGVCVSSISAGSFNLAREPFNLSLTTPAPPMELTLHDDCGTLALNLPPGLATFLPGEEPYYTVYVVPDFDTVQQIPPMTMHPSSGPSLTLDSLPPGSYHVYFFDSPVHLEYRNPAALAALSQVGQEVTVGAGTTTNLTLEAPGH